MAFKMRGYSYPGTSPIRAVTEPMKPASSKEELIEAAQGFVRPVQTMDLDYGGGFDVDINIDTPSGGPTPPLKPKAPSGEKPIVTRTPEDIMGIKKDRIKVKGASKQKHYKSSGGFGEDSKNIKAPDVKTYKIDESKSTKEKKIRVATPKELAKKNKTKAKKVVKKSGKKKSNWLKRLFKRKN